MIRISPILFLTLFFSNMFYASDIGLAGMGNLQYLFQEDFNKLNLFDFARMPAGFLADDSTSLLSIGCSGLKQRWQKDSLTYWSLGQALPEKIREYAPLEALGSFGVTDLPQVTLPPCQINYEKRRLDEGYGTFGEKLYPQAWGFNISYGQLSRDDDDTLGDDIVRTPQFSLVLSRTLSDNFTIGVQGDGFYGDYRSADREDEAILKPLGGSLGIGFQRGHFQLGLNGEYHYPIFQFKNHGAYGYTEDFRGHAFAPSVAGIVNFENLCWANRLALRRANLRGKYHDTDDDMVLGDLSLLDYEAKSQILLRIEKFLIAVFGQYDRKAPSFADTGGNRKYDVFYNDYAGAIGIGIQTSRIRAGFEGEYWFNRLEDRIQDVTITGSDLALRIGSEFEISGNLVFRCGFNHTLFDPESDMPDDRLKSNLVTCGLGMGLTPWARLDLTYNHRWQAFEADTEEKVTDQILLVYFRYSFL